MIFPRLAPLVMCLVVLSSCSKKAKNQSQGEYVAAVLSEDAVPVTRPLPTRPNGGNVDGKSQTLDPEEVERRRNKNIVEPIVFGTSVAGISMTTRYSTAMNTLAYYTSQNGIDFFSEHIVAVWGQGADPVPFQLGIQAGYAGKLSLPAPYGDVTIGQEMSGLIGSINELRQFMLIMGAAFENQPLATYNCETALTCQLDENADFFMLDFRKGGVYLEKTASLPIGFIYFTQPQRFFAPLTDAMIHNLSIGGLTFLSKRSTAESRMGPPVLRQQEGGIVFYYYDRGNFAVSWSNEDSPDATPNSFKAVGAYQGGLDFKGTIGVRKLGESFASYATTADAGGALLLALDRSLNPSHAAIDCQITTPATCQAVIDSTVTPSRLLLVIDGSVYSFTNDANRTWLSAGMRK